jgi:protoporphyrinogen oxidase
VYVPFYLPQDHPQYKKNDDHFVGQVKSYLMRINNNLTSQSFISFHVSRYQHAQPICRTGHQGDLPSVVTPIEGLLIADTSFYYPEDRGMSESIKFGRKLAKISIQQP